MGNRNVLITLTFFGRSANFEKDIDRLSKMSCPNDLEDSKSLGSSKSNVEDIVDEFQQVLKERQQTPRKPISTLATMDLNCWTALCSRVYGRLQFNSPLSIPGLFLKAAPRLGADCRDMQRAVGPGGIDEQTLVKLAALQAFQICGRDGAFKG